MLLPCQVTRELTGAVGEVESLMQRVDAGHMAEASADVDALLQKLQGETCKNVGALTFLNSRG